MSRREGNRPPLKDWHLWTEVTRSVSPLRPERVLLLSDTPLPLPPDEENPPPVTLPKDWTIGSTARREPSAVYPVKHKGQHDRPIEPRMRRKLMRGQIQIDGTIDLHGMRQDEAHAALNRFIAARAARGDRTILVITGKGLKKLDDTTIIERGVLRSMLPLWLSQPSLAPLVAGWSVAAQAHGGEGAFYIRLKRVAP